MIPPTWSSRRKTKNIATNCASEMTSGRDEAYHQQSVKRATIPRQFELALHSAARTSPHKARACHSSFASSVLRRKKEGHSLDTGSVPKKVWGESGTLVLVPLKPTIGLFLMKGTSKPAAANRCGNCSRSKTPGHGTLAQKRPFPVRVLIGCPFDGWQFKNERERGGQPRNGTPGAHHHPLDTVTYLSVHVAVCTWPLCSSSQGRQKGFIHHSTLCFPGERIESSQTEQPNVQHGVDGELEQQNPCALESHPVGRWGARLWVCRMDHRHGLIDGWLHVGPM